MEREKGWFDSAHHILKLILYRKRLYRKEEYKDCTYSILSLWFSLAHHHELVEWSKDGAREGIRTLGLFLGKEAFYR